MLQLPLFPTEISGQRNLKPLYVHFFNAVMTKLSHVMNMQTCFTRLLTSIVRMLPLGSLACLIDLIWFL